MDPKTLEIKLVPEVQGTVSSITPPPQPMYRNGAFSNAFSTAFDIRRRI